MKKIDFSKIVVKGIDGKPYEVTRKRPFLLRQGPSYL